MKVDIAVLKLANRVIFEHIESLGVNEIDLQNDFYWSIPKEEVYDPYKTPSNLTLGQLDDDYNELKTLTENPQKVLSYALVWLSTIYRAIGENVVR